MSYLKQKKFEGLTKEEKLGLMFDLINSFRIVKGPLETALFLQDLLTANEIRNLSIRLRIAKLLLSGRTHREIQDELHSSLATITKVRSWLERGGDGFNNVIAKLPLKWEMPKKLPQGPIEFHLPQALLALAQYSIAKSQQKTAEEFIKEIENKKKLDRNLRKLFDTYYKEQAIETKSRKRKEQFIQKKATSTQEIKT